MAALLLPFCFFFFFLFKFELFGYLGSFSFFFLSQLGLLRFDFPQFVIGQSLRHFWLFIGRALVAFRVRVRRTRIPVNCALSIEVRDSWAFWRLFPHEFLIQLRVQVLHGPRRPVNVDWLIFALVGEVTDFQALLALLDTRTSVFFYPGKHALAFIGRARVFF